MELIILEIDSLLYVPYTKQESLRWTHCHIYIIRLKGRNTFSRLHIFLNLCLLRCTLNRIKNIRHLLLRLKYYDVFFFCIPGLASLKITKRTTDNSNTINKIRKFPFISIKKVSYHNDDEAIETHIFKMINRPSNLYHQVLFWNFMHRIINNP